MKGVIKVALGQTSCCFRRCHSIDASINPGMLEKMLPQHSDSELWHCTKVRTTAQVLSEMHKKGVRNRPIRFQDWSTFTEITRFKSIYHLSSNI